MGADEKQGLLLLEAGGVAPTQTETISVCGSQFQKNGWPWHFAILFKLPVTDAEKKAFGEPMKHPQKLWGKIFSGVNGTGALPQSVKEGMTKMDFHHAVFNEIVTILSGPRNGLQLDTKKSIDEDELILTVGLTDPEAKKQLAHMEDLSVRLSQTLYDEKKVDVPTSTKQYTGLDYNAAGKFVPSPGKELNGDEIPNNHNAYLRYSAKKAHMFEEVSQLDCIRLVKRRLLKFLHMDELVDHDIVNQWFPVHHWDELDELHKKGWNNPTRILQWPSEARSDSINKYFGPEMAFFFHWYNHLTRWLAFPAILSIFTYGARISGLVSRIQINYVSMAFAVMLVIWSSIYVSQYRQAKNLKQNKWGMENLGASALVVRKQFKDAYRDSFADYAQHFFHWFMVVFFVFETIMAVYYVTQMQVRAKQHPHEHGPFGIPNEYIAQYAKYLITINIKLVDKVWTPISNMLTNRENWRSVQELQQSMIAKMFCVKMFVFYYPFVYIIVIQPYTKGCGPDNSRNDLTGCIDELNESLILFFFSQIAIEIALLIAYLGLAAWGVRSERSKHPDKEYTYLELQGKTMPYTEEDLISDSLNAVVTYGYIILFGVSLPFMCLLGFLTNLVMIRLVAYKVSYAYQRPMPKAMDGIGTWEGVMRILGYVGVLTNAYIAMFTLRAFRDEDMVWKLIMFIVLQNVGMGLKMAIEGLFDERNSAHKRIIEYHDDCKDVLLDEKDPPQIGDGKVAALESPFK
eukprot:TRINITY_DN3427_c0_g1_i1.p1 TRINITY_DN3427_c0_g1~~TRINITY_DN3427_c0_g1_i1.p1  ORF type:complete len:742 (-),score=120.18 TRINITY_DN3427_c0_g1_i1:16-2241(-)